MKKTIMMLSLAIFATVMISGNIQDKKQQKVQAEKTTYTCPMHSAVKQDKPGKCPECGMKLTAMETKKDTYTCPMHAEVKQDKPGKCPKCGMNLVAEKKADPKKK